MNNGISGLPRPGLGPVVMNRVVFSTAGSFFYVPPSNLIAVDVEVEGGHGGSNAGQWAGTGGYSKRLIQAQLLPPSTPVVVGAGGAGGNGGTSSFGSFLSATGSLLSSTGNPAGGLGAGGDINLPGASGASGNTGTGCLLSYAARLVGRISGLAGGNGVNGSPGAVIITEYLRGAA